jgi:NAD(P)-dependent dehydrogenase (short-subunit alcohol dehydrogenase family)
VTAWLITGVSSGLGGALARAALARGDTVAGTARRAEDLSAFEALAPSRAYGFLADLADEAQVRAAVAGAEAATGGLDVLVNNAGYGLVGAVEETSLAEARAQFEVNVLGPLAAIQAALPFMRARRAGRILNITSVSGLATWAGTGIYCAGKHALEAIGQTLADEVAAFGISVTNIEPGGMRTDYAGRSLVETAARIGDYDGGVARQSRAILAEHAGHEPGDPDKVAAAILTVADSPAPPRHLLLGADAMLYATRQMSALQAEIGQWSALTHSTAFAEGC